MTVNWSVSLRPFQPDDAPAFCEAVNASLDTLMPFLNWAHEDYRPEEAASWIAFTGQQRLRDEAEEFAIVDAHGRLLGGAGIRFTTQPGQPASLGYWVRSDAQRRGVACAAVIALIQRGFTRSGIETIEILAAETNFASRTVAERCGARLVDIRYGLIILPSGPVNTAIYHFQRKSSLLFTTDHSEPIAQCRNAAFIAAEHG